jgi:hypothetical protein
MHLIPDGAHLAGPVTPTRLLGIRIHDADLSGADQGGCDGDHGRDDCLSVFRASSDAHRLLGPSAVDRIGRKLQVRVMQLEREAPPQPGLRRTRRKLPRKSNQVARGRIRRFESNMPSHAVGLRVREKPANIPGGLGCYRLGTSYGGSGP